MFGIGREAVVEGSYRQDGGAGESEDRRQRRKDGPRRSVRIPEGSAMDETISVRALKCGGERRGKKYTRRNFGDDEGVGFGEDEEGVRRCRSKVWRGEVGEYGMSN